MISKIVSHFEPESGGIRSGQGLNQGVVWITHRRLLKGSTGSKPGQSSEPMKKLRAQEQNCLVARDLASFAT
jgi:hypothetical protein